MYQVIKPYSLHGLQIAISRLFIYVLYFTLVVSKLKYASAVWNCITPMSANRFESIQQKFASVCFCRVSPQVRHSNTCALENLSLHSLRKRRHNFDAFSFFQVYRGLKFCPSLLENVSPRVPTRCVTNFPCPMFAPQLDILLLLRDPMLPAWCVNTQIYFYSNHFLSNVLYNHIYLYFPNHFNIYFISFCLEWFYVFKGKVQIVAC
jgi:hypothetical protein